MPIYEGISVPYGDYKQPSVLDIGSAYTKIGISGEYAPRAIIRTEVQCRRTNKRRKISSFKNGEDLYDLLVEFVHTIYFKYLLVNPKDKPVVIVECLLAPTVWRETVARVLFRHYEVASLLVVPSHLVALAPLAVDTGLVLDVGHSGATVIPVYSGVPVVHAWQALPLGAHAVHDHIRVLLAQDNLTSCVAQLPDTVLEDISVRCCFVTSACRAKQLREAASEMKEAEGVLYTLGGGSVVVSGRARELAHEVQHDEDNDHLCLATMLLDATQRVAVDMRLALLANIVVIGGGAMATGFRERLHQELSSQVAVNAHRYGDLSSAVFKYHTLPGKENYAAWLGGAIYGCTEIVGMKAFTRDQYYKENRLPDWIDIPDNRGRS